MKNLFIFRLTKILIQAIKFSIRFFCMLLPSIIKTEILKNISLILQIQSAQVDGDLGLISGSPVDVVWRSYAREKRWAPGITEFLTSKVYIESKGTFFDIGANIGLTTIPIAANAEIQCYCFEPDKTNFAFLKKNIEDNLTTSNVKLYNFALYSKVGEMELELSHDNLGDHRIRTSDSEISMLMKEEDRAIIKTPVRTLDSLYSDFTLAKPVVVKMDTQGSELHILEGGESFFSHVDYLIIEFSPYHLLRSGTKLSDFFNALLQFPYGGIMNDLKKTLFAIEQTDKIIQQMSQDEEFLRGRFLNRHIDLLLMSEHSFKNLK